MGGHNQPIVALIPDDRVYVRFFVPEAAVAAYRPAPGSGSAATAARTA